MERIKLAAETDGAPEIPALMAELGYAARKAAHKLSLAPAEVKNRALRMAGAKIRPRMAEIPAANAQDMTEAKHRGPATAFLDRLALDEKRIAGMAAGLDEIATLPDPVGRLLARFERPNGLTIERVATPLGVIGGIFESRPAVTADAGALCLKAGNAAILRGGSESFHSISLIHSCL